MSNSGSENRASSTPLGRWVRRLAACAVLGTLMVAGAETTVRIEDRIHWGTPLLSRATSQEDLVVSDATGRHPMPGATFRKWHINSVGTRGPEPDPAQAGARVIVLGASETYGLYESPDHEYVRQLADTIASHNCPSDVLNAGFPGMSLPTVEQDFRLRLSALHPVAAVYYPTPPQYLDADGLPHAAKPDSSGRVVSDQFRLSLHFPFGLRFAMRARDAFKGMLPRPVQDMMRKSELAKQYGKHPADWVFSTVPQDRLEAFDQDLRQLVGTLKLRGATPILVTHANAFIGSPPAADDRLRAWEYQYPRATGATLVAFDSVANERIRQVARDSGATLVDAWRAFHGLPSDSMFADFSHFTDAGAALMASMLRPALARALGCREE